MYSQHTLNNGIKVILSPLKETKAVTALVLVKVGSRYEAAATNGISHFLEHMMFKGTKRRPTSLKIAHELDSIGADYNAFTSKDHTGYYITSDIRELPLLLDMLADLLQNALLQEEEVQREKNVIVEEINMYEDNPMMFIGDLFERVLYQGSTLGWEIAGKRETVRAMTSKKLATFRQTYYHPGRITIGIGGNIDGGFIIPELNRLFTQQRRSFGKAYRPFHVRQTSSRVRLHYKETEQVHLALGFPSYKHGDKRLPALSLLHIILGGNMSSRLFIAVRERRGLAYYVRTGAESYEDTGSFDVTSGLSSDRIDLALKTIMAELGRVREKGVTDKELEKAKHYVRGKTTLAMEETSSLVSFYARQVMFGMPVKTPEQKIEELFRVTRADVQAVARDVFRTDRLNLALIGPFKDESRFKKLLRV